MHGGRGSGKTSRIADMLATRAANVPLHILCGQNHFAGRHMRQNFDFAMDRLNIPGHVSLQHQNTIRLANGSTIECQDLGCVDRDAYYGVDILWVDNAQRLSKERLEDLCCYLRKPGSELWFSFNPSPEHDPVWTMFVTDPPREDTLVVQVNYPDNPWFPLAMEETRRVTQERDPDLYNNIWLGETKPKPKENADGLAVTGLGESIPAVPR